MNIYVNSTPREITSDSKIDDLLTVLNISTQRGVAIAVNNNVIPKAEWNSYLLQEEDKVTLIRATQGG